MVGSPDDDLGVASRPTPLVGDQVGRRLLALLSSTMVVCASCSHTRPMRELNARTYVIDEDARGVGGAVGTGGSGYNCDDELNKCFTRCWESSHQPYPHVERNEWYYEYCTRECRKQYLQCVEELEKEEAERVKRRPPLEFSSFDKARAWIRAHKSAVTLGTVVIVSGVAFILVTGGSGALILAPLAF